MPYKDTLMPACPVRARVQTGDLIAWNHSPQGTDGFWFRLVRFLTMSEYGHVSVAVREGDKLFHVEAVIPAIQKVELPPNILFYTVPLSRAIEGEVNMAFLNEKIGQKYSYLDAIRAYIGKVTKKDDQWQCAELTNEFYASNGLYLSPKSLTPSRLVRAAMLVEDLHLAKTCSK